eukprot:GGOE01021103.1.p1 GENE.GGOE01021103.1~~GGOE01021103.1.p1  ORF type:complete len:1329 (-),score=336.30 GGOE01021103.1:239-4225(-)
MSMASDLQLLKELEQLLSGSSTKFNQKCQQSLPLIARVMKGSLNDADIQKRCVCVLKEFCYESEANATHLPTTDVFPMLFTILKHHHSQPPVVLQVFGLFVNLTVVESNRTLISEKGGIASTLQIMEKLAKNEEVQRMGMMVLRNVSCDAPRCQKEIALRHGVELLFQAANRYQQNPDIAEQFIATLLHVSHTPEACQGIVEQGGIHLFLELTSRPTEYPSALVEMAVAVLVNLSLVPEALDALVGDGIVPIMVKAAQTKEGGLIARRAIQVIGNLACSDDLRTVVLKNGALKAVVDTMQHSKGDADTIRVSSWALCNLIANNEKAQKELATSLGGVTLAASLFKRHTQDHEVLLNCTKLLWTLCEALPEIQEDVSKQAMPLLIPAVETHAQDKELLEELLSLLVTLTRNVNTHPDFHQAKGAKVFGEVLKANRSNPSVCLLCFRLLMSVAEAEEEKESGGLAEKRLVICIMKPILGCKSDQEIQMKGCKLLALLLGHHPTLAEGIVSRKGLEVIVQHARDHWEVPGLLRCYLSVLLNVSINQPSHQALVNAGVVDLALQALSEQQGLADVSKRCLWLLGNLLGGGQDLEEQHWPLVLRAMEVHRPDAEVQLGGTWILDVLTSEENRLEPLQALGALDAVTTALTQHTGHMAVQQRGLEVLLNYAASRQRSHRSLVPPMALDHLLKVLETWPAATVLLGFRVLGELADVQQAHLQAQDAVGCIQRAMRAHEAEMQVQADGAAALCRIAAATDNWAVLVRGNVLEGLLSLQSCDPHPSVQRACSWAFRALPGLPAGVEALLQTNVAIPTMLGMVTSSEDDEVRQMILLTLAQVVSCADMDALRPHTEALLALRDGRLGDARDARLLACLCVFNAALLTKGLLAGSEGEAHRVLGFLERCRECDSCDFHDLRLMVGLQLCSLLVALPGLRQVLLRSKAVVDTTWQAAQDLQRCPDVVAEFGLGETQLAVCQQALDALLEAQPLSESATPSGNAMPEREDREAWRQSVAEARRQRALRDRQEYEKKGKKERREVSGGAFHAGAIPEEENVVSPTSEPHIVSQLLETGAPPDAEGQRVVPKEHTADPADVAALLEVEEAESWARYHLEMDALEARRRVGVRMAQHRKALAERGSAMSTMMQTWYTRIVEETSASTMKEDELRQGTSYLQAAVENGPTRRPVPPRPPLPTEEVAPGRSAPNVESGESPDPIPGKPPVPRPMTIGEAASFSPTGKRRTPPLHLRNVIGWETLVSKTQRPRLAADTMPDASGGPWSEAGLVRRMSPPADHQVPGTSMLPGYIYFQRTQEDFAVHPPTVLGTNFRSVAVPSSLPVA